MMDTHPSKKQCVGVRVWDDEIEIKPEKQRATLNVDIWFLVFEQVLIFNLFISPTFF